MNYCIIRSDELYHHGILGQKWGVRRYQNADGSLTAAGRAHYGIQEAKEAKKDYILNVRKNMSFEKKNKALNYYKYKKSKVIDDVVSPKNDYKISSKDKKKYDSLIEKGLTDEEARKRIHTDKVLKRVLIGTAAVTLTAIVASSAYRYGKAYRDSTINSGEVMRNFNFEGVWDLKSKDAFYTSKNKSDKMQYGMLYKMKKNNGGLLGTPIDKDVYETILKSNKDIKLAGIKTGKDTLGEMMKNDESFRKKVISDLKQYKTIDPNYRVSNLLVNHLAMKDLENGKYDSKYVYEMFNKTLTNSSEHARQFYSNLEKKGYSGLSDVNDRLLSGYKSKANIIFDKNSNITINSNHKVSDKELKKYMTLGQLVQFKNLYMPYTLAAIGGGAVSGYNKRNANQKAYDKIVSDYRKEHPNSELSYDEIISNYYKK